MTTAAHRNAQAAQATRASGPPGATALTPDRSAETRRTGLLLLAGGLIGTLASGMLAYDRIRTLEDPLFTPGCNINAVLSCGDVMTAWQSELLGPPNALLGLAAFAALAGLGLAVAAGARLPRRLWQGLWAALAAGFALTLWLIGQCLYVIGALCPWCTAVWAVMIPLFWYVTRHLARPGSPLRALPHWLVPAALYLAVAALVVTRFGTGLL